MLTDNRRNEIFFLSPTVSVFSRFYRDEIEKNLTCNLQQGHRTAYFEKQNKTKTLHVVQLTNTT